MRDPAATGQPSPVERSSSPPCGAPPSVRPEPLQYGFLSLSLFQVSSHLCDFASVPDAVTRPKCLTPPTGPALLYLFLSFFFFFLLQFSLSFFLSLISLFLFFAQFFFVLLLSTYFTVSVHFFFIVLLI
jgi:hypothetical protein